MSERKSSSRLRQVLLAWAALMALMFCSLGSAYLPLGRWNLAIGLAIAAAKSAIVAVVFMKLALGSPLVRLAAATGLSTLALLLSLSQFEASTRAQERAAVQPPQQLRPLAEGGSGR